MMREPSMAWRSLRAVSIMITLVSVVTFGTMIYSTYEDATATLAAIGNPSHQGFGTQTTVSGNTAQVALNFSLFNKGLYPLGVNLSCAPSQSLPVSCQPVQVSVPPGVTKSVRLVLSVNDVTKLQSIATGAAQLHLNATASVSLEPFATLSVTFDLGSALSGGHL